MYDYALVHIIYTIPVAIVLTIILRPLATGRDLYKILFLLFVAFTYTIPWDSYLIRTGVWTYPPDAILGPTLFDIPAEELFFFLIQTYITTCLQILLNKSTLPAVHLRNEYDEKDAEVSRIEIRKRLVQISLAFCFIVPLFSFEGSHEGTYMRLISIWASPVLLMLWSFAYQLLLGLPRSKTWLPIWIPTLYLWIVDTLALRRGTWSIVSGTKLGIQLWPHLDLEEAVFFLVTNMLVVWGACAFDNAIAILDAFPNKFTLNCGNLSPIVLVKALLLPTSEYDTKWLRGFRNALPVLAKKSRSFYLASGVFTGRLRIDLILLYAFCRVADDLIDNASDATEAEKWIQNFSNFLDVAYSEKQDTQKLDDALEPFPLEAQTILKLFPVDKLPAKPLYSLLDGFRIDLQFLDTNPSKGPPIKTSADLERYAACVAGTIGELCVNLVYFYETRPRSEDDGTKHDCLSAAARMGQVLQYINIVRDVYTDAKVGRCYIPDEWFDKSKSDSSPDSFKEELTKQRQKLLNIAFNIYGENRDAIEALPAHARDGIRVAVESYVEIGRVMQERIQKGLPLDFDGGGQKGRASVPRWRRVLVGWRTMAGWRGSLEGSKPN